MADGSGMYLEVAPSGGKWWRFKYRIGGKEKRLSLGTYPDVALVDARERRDAARKLVAKGTDPSEQRKAEKRNAANKGANSFESVAREWYQKQTNTWVPTSRVRCTSPLGDKSLSGARRVSDCRNNGAAAPDGVAQN